ncbi:FixH family protein [Tardiphaga sp.]|uniref:FixH family protein n=1 Tax=Tardiphaga sp. TaxID=1926292 RepID=UPI0026101CA4|nr:FixH family protein [Tardiphaga sp.]MDB5620299.1 nitrogen fixation protein FixH [Tardiphaga sp.]
MTTSTVKPLTGRTVLICLIAFFGVIIGVNITLAKLAIDSLPGTEVDSAYGASLAYEGEITAAREQAARGWKVNAHVARDADGRAEVRVEARDRNGAPVQGLSFTSRLERPADRRGDRPVQLAEAGTATYRGDVTALAPGLWDLVLEGDVGGKRLFLSKNRIVLN